MNSITITLPLPPRSLHPNGRAHHMAKAKATKECRGLAKMEAMVAAFDNPNAHSMPWQRVEIQVACYHKTANHQDADNILASCKAYFDGIADAGVIVNDRDCAYPPVIRETDKSNPRVELTIRSL